MNVILAIDNYTCTVKPLKSKRTKAAFRLLSIFLLFALILSPASAAVEWEISPSSSALGDTLKIRGMASPDERIKAEVSFEEEVPVSGGRYQYFLEDVKIPEGDENRFTVQAEGVQDLHVGVKKGIWINLQAEAANGVATISQANVPPWTYGILIDGNALGESPVNLKITASQTLKADSEGAFEYSYPTSSMPAGKFRINIGGFEKTLDLKAGDNKNLESSTPKTTPKTGETPGKTPALTELQNGSDEIQKVARVEAGSDWEPAKEAVIRPDYGQYWKCLVLGILAGVLVSFLFKKECK